MAQYTPPLRDMQFVLHELLHVTDEFKAMPKHAELDADTVNAVLEEGGKFAAEVLFPLNQSGDAEGCTLDHATRTVRSPKGFSAAYAQYIEGGWAALSCDPEFGGQGLPITINQCFFEMLNSANQAWTMYPGLTHGAYECLHEHGTPEQKAIYLPKLTTGQWLGTMCLTEAHCGTDLGMLRTKAEPVRECRRQLPNQRLEDLHQLGRQRPGREHRAPGAGAPAGRADGFQGHLAVRGAEVPAKTGHRRRCQGRSHGRRTQWHLLHGAGAQDGHQWQCHLPDEPGKRHRLAWWASRTAAWPRCS